MDSDFFSFLFILLFSFNFESTYIYRKILLIAWALTISYIYVHCVRLLHHECRIFVFFRNSFHTIFPLLSRKWKLLGISISPADIFSLHSFLCLADHIFIILSLSGFQFSFPNNKYPKAPYLSKSGKRTGSFIIPVTKYLLIAPGFWVLVSHQ